MTPRSCCVCGGRGGLVRYRAAEIAGGPAQWVCGDADACAARLGPLRIEIELPQPNG